MVIDSTWTQEQEGKIQVAQECKESAGKRWQGLVPETAADQSSSQYHHLVAALQSQGCFSDRKSAIPWNYLAESKITQNTADTKLTLAYIVAKRDKRWSSP